MFMLTSVPGSTSLMIWWTYFVKIWEVLAISTKLMIYSAFCLSFRKRELVGNGRLRIILPWPWFCPPTVLKRNGGEERCFQQKENKSHFLIYSTDVKYNSLKKGMLAVFSSVHIFLKMHSCISYDWIPLWVYIGGVTTFTNIHGNCISRSDDRYYTSG